MIPEDLWVVSMDKEQISQVIVALLQNAEHSMPDGGTITISLANRELVEEQVVGLYPGKYVMISLADEGQGIEPQYLDKIFDPYFSTKEKDSNKGAGLGLAIVHSIVNKHEGKIIVESTPGKGTIFTLYLPALSAETGRRFERSTILPSSKGKVLVVDKAGEGRDTLCDMFVHIGYSPEPIDNGPAAIETYGQARQSGDPYAAVLLVLAKDGDRQDQATVADLRKVDPRVKILAACTPADTRAAQEYIEQGFCGIIAMPYQLLDLNRVMAALQGK